MIHEIMSQLPVDGELTIRQAKFPKTEEFIVLTVKNDKKKYKISGPAIYKKDWSDTSVLNGITDLIYLYNRNCPL